MLIIILAHISGLGFACRGELPCRDPHLLVIIVINDLGSDRVRLGVGQALLIILVEDIDLVRRILECFQWLPRLILIRA